MTVSTTTSRVSYSGNGSTVTFTVPFYFIYSTDLKVYKTSSANVQTLLVEGTDYTVTGAGVISGGSITCTTAPSSDYTIIIYRDPATTQLVDYQANDPFPAETHERALDKLTMIAQRLNDVNDRSFHLSDGDDSGANLEISSPEANYLIGWNSTGDALQNVDPASLATVVAYATAHADTFTGDGTTTSWTLSANPGVLYNLDVSINGVTQVPVIDYTYSGTTFTTTTAAPLNAVILVKYKEGLPNYSGDSQDIQYTPSGTGAVATTVQTKLRETVSVKDFGVTDSTSAAFNTTALQAALNSLSNGGTLEINTSFSVNGEILIPYDNITVIGKNDPLITQSVAGLRVFYGPDRQNCSVLNIRFNGTTSSTPYNGDPTEGSGRGLLHFYKNTTNPSNIRINGCEIYNAFTPISCTNVQNLWVENNICRNFYKYGILASKSYNFNIDKNNIYTCDNNTAANTYGVMATGDQAGGNTQQRCSISFNIIDTVVSWDGIMSHDCTGLRIIGNDIKNVRCGVDLTYTAATQIIKDVVVSGNTISLTTTNNWGATAAQSAGITVIGVAASSAYIQGIVISDNIIKNANSITGATLTGNVYAAIQLDTIVDAVITGNVIEDFGSINGMDGIAIYNPGDSVKISENAMRGALGSAGIRALLAASGTSTNLSVNDNSVNTSVAAGSIVVFGVASGTGTFNSLVCTGNSTNATNKSYATSGSVTLNFEDGDGIFTPAITFGGGSTSITYSEQVGVYRKTGNKVWFDISIQLTNKGSSTGNLAITGLPFTAKSSPSYYPFAPYIQNMASITGQVIGVVQGTLNYAQLYQVSASTVAVLTDTNFANNSRIALQGFISVA